MENCNEIKKIAEIIKKFQPEISEEKLEQQAKDIWGLALFCVRLRIKQHSNPTKPQNSDVYQSEPKNPP